MATWAKIKLYYETMLGSLGSTLTATSTAANYDVANIYNMLETNSWKAANTAVPMYITYDSGGTPKNADYLIIYGHNLNTANAKITLQYSTDNFVADINDTFTGEKPLSDNIYRKEFTSPGAKRYWRLKIENNTGGPALGTIPYMKLCIWGQKTELDYATASYDPYEEMAQSTINRTQGGVVAGIHTDYTDRNLAFSIADADSTLYQKVKTWRDAHGMKQLFVAWETANNPDDCWLVYPKESFSNPFTSNSGGAYRDISLSFKGRKV